MFTRDTRGQRDRHRALIRDKEKVEFVAESMTHGTCLLETHGVRERNTVRLVRGRETDTVLVTERERETVRLVCVAVCCSVL